MTLQEILNTQRSMIDAARAENRSFTAEEQTRFEELTRQANEAILRMQQPAPAPAAPAAPAVPATPAEPEHRDEDPTMLERRRVTEITALCRNFNENPDEFIKNGKTVDEVRAAILEKLRTTGAPVNMRVGTTGEEREAAAVTDALLMRSGIQIQNPAEGAEDFRGASLKQIAARCLARENNGSAADYAIMDGSRLFDELIKRSYLSPEAAFPAILDNTIEKAYVEGHRTAPVTFDQFTVRGTLSDFKKATNRYVAGAFGDFLEVPEGGELKHFIPQDEKLPQKQLKTYGRQFTLSRQAFIDDDIGLITRLPAQAAAAARRTQNKQVYQILVNNPKIYDGAVLFGSAHKNLLKTGTGVIREAVEAMILALGGHKNDAGDAILIRPAHIIVPLGYKFDMFTLFNSATIDNAGTVNPLLQYRDAIQITEDATLNALVKDGEAIPWFMAGDATDAAGIEVDYLNGQEIPNVRRMEVSGQLGFVWDFYLDWGVSVQDYRAFVKNPGVVVKSPLDLA